MDQPNETNLPASERYSFSLINSETNPKPTTNAPRRAVIRANSVASTSIYSVLYIFTEMSLGNKFERNEETHFLIKRVARDRNTRTFDLHRDHVNME